MQVACQMVHWIQQALIKRSMDGEARESDNEVKESDNEVKESSNEAKESGNEAHKRRAMVNGDDIHVKMASSDGKAGKDEVNKGR